MNDFNHLLLVGRLISIEIILKSKNVNFVILTATGKRANYLRRREMYQIIHILRINAELISLP